MKGPRLARHLFVGCALAALLAPGCASRFGPYTAPEDEYGYKGDLAPRNWAALSPKFALCDAGKRQSPIDVGDVVPGRIESIRYAYQPTTLRVRHTEHTLRMDVDPGSTLEVDGVVYEWRELHFHRISEHAVRGRQFPLEAHLVHESDDGRLLIVAAFVKFGDWNRQLMRIQQLAPLERGQASEPSEITFDANQFLGPEDERRFYRYEGSLTVPPCTEGVQWLVLERVLVAGMKQQYHFRRLVHGNYRPIQPHNGRTVSLEPAAP